MLSPDTITVLTNEQVTELEELVDGVAPGLRRWAVDEGVIEGPARPFVRTLAAFVVAEYVREAAAYEADFRSAIRQDTPLDRPIGRSDPKTPTERAGLAAGVWSRAVFISHMYGLTEQEVAQAIPEDCNTGDQRSEPRVRMIGSGPQHLGFTQLSSHDVFVDTLLEAEGAVRASGHTALQPFMDIPLYRDAPAA